jgi:cell fate (sporulation/competence/biofilm development) regulator YlbF (YheA/YmcA/DUF963 family)
MSETAYNAPALEPVVSLTGHQPNEDKMEEILDLAARLGKAIGADPRASRLREARAELEASLEDRQLLADYEKQQQVVRRLELENKPIEPNDKRKLADLHAGVIGSEVLKRLLTAEADYIELSALVHQRIEQEIFRSPAKT